MFDAKHTKVLIFNQKQQDVFKAHQAFLSCLGDLLKNQPLERELSPRRLSKEDLFAEHSDGISILKIRLMISRLFQAFSFLISWLIFFFLWACEDVKPLTLTITAPEQVLVLGQAFEIKATASAKASIAWSITQRPTGSTQVIEAFTLSEGNFGRFIPDALGSYTFLAIAKGENQTEATASVTLDVNCRPPMWEISLSSQTGFEGLIGKSTELIAQLSAKQDEACPEVPALTPNITWQMLSKPAASNASLIPIAQTVRQLFVDQLGSYLIQATVSDALNRSNSTQAVIKAQCGNHVPQITIQSVTQGNIDEAISLAVSVSDEDEACGLQQALSIDWQWVEKPIGSQAQLAQIQSLSPWFTPDLSGTYKIKAKVTDDQGFTANAETTIVVSECGTHAPSINRISLQPNDRLMIGVPIQFYADWVDLDQEQPCAREGSHRFRWTLIKAPVNSIALPSLEFGTQPFLTPDQPGEYEIELEITDERGLFSTYRFPFQVSDCGNAAPSVTINQNPNQNIQAVTIAEVVTIEAIANDRDEACGLIEELSLKWKLLSQPAGSQAIRLPDEWSNLSSFSFMPDLPGTYLIEITPKDQSNLIGQSIVVSINASDCGMRPPKIISLEQEQNQIRQTRVVQAQEVLSFEARVNDALSLYVNIEDPNEACGQALTGLNYEWYLEKKPLGSQSQIVDNQARFLDFFLDLPGEYQGKIRLTDMHGHSVEQAFVIQAGTCGTASPTISWVEENVPIYQQQTPVSFTVSIDDLDQHAGCGLDQQLTLSWAFIDVPAGSQSEMQHTQGLSNWFIPDQVGTYRVLVTVTDPQGHQASLEKSMTVLDCQQALPQVISILSNQDQSTEIRVGTVLSLNAVWAEAEELNCIGIDGNHLAQTELSWQILDRPIGSITQLNQPHSHQPWFIADRAGTYLIEVMLSYPNLNQYQRETRAISVGACGAFAPTVQIINPQQQINLGQPIHLTAIAADPDPSCLLDHPETLTYHWQMLESPADAEIPDFEESSSLVWQANQPGKYRLSVTVTDTQNRVSLPAFIELFVLECGSLAPEVQDIELTGDRLVNAPLLLSAMSRDPNESCGQAGPLSYQWRFLKTPLQETTLAFPSNAANQSTPRLLLPTAGNYEVEVEVKNQFNQSTQKTLAFSIDRCGSLKPIAKAKIDPNTPAMVGQIIQLDAQESFDPDALTPCLQEGKLSYEWRIDQVPAGYQAEQSFPVSLFGQKPWLYLPIAGTYQISLWVKDQSGLQSELPSVLSFEAQGCGQQPPMIEQINLNQQSPQRSSPLVLSATVVDPDTACGGITQADVQWRMISSPTGQLLTLSSGQSTSFTPTEIGDYTIEAVAIGIDGRQSSNAKQITFEVNDCGGFTPSIALVLKLPTDEQGPTTQQSLVLQAQTQDQDEQGACALNQARTVSWQLLSQPLNSNLLFTLDPTESLIGEKANQAAIRFMATQTGDYRFEATVTDITGKASRQQIVVAIQACGELKPEIKSISSSVGPYQIGQPIDIQADIATTGIACSSGSDQSTRWQWYLSRPHQSLSILEGGNSNAQQLIPDQAGSYIISAILSNGTGQVSQLKSISIDVVNCGDQAPIIQSINTSPITLTSLSIGQNLSFTVNAIDPDQGCGQASTLLPSWRLISRPPESQASLLNVQSMTAQLQADVAGEYVIEAIVVEATGQQKASIPQRLSFTVGNCGALPPKAMISSGAPKSIPAAESISTSVYGCNGAAFIQLDAQNSLDQNLSCGGSGILSYHWQVVELSAGLSVSLRGEQAQSLNLAAQGMTVGQSSRVKVKLTVENDKGVKAEAFATIDILALNEPHTHSITPSFFCGQAQQITLNGNHYYRYKGNLPTVQIGTLSLTANSASNCTPVIAGELEICTQLSALIPSGLSAELYETTVQNPYPLACQDALPPSAFVLSAPKIDQSSPLPICRGQFNGQITLNGSGFLKVPALNQQTQISINQVSALNPQITQCENINSFQLCQKASFELPASQKDVANLNIKLSNPNPGACLPQDLEVQYLLKQSEPPLINDVIPKKICDQGGSIDLIGDHFEPNMTVALGPYLADTVVNTNGEQRVKATWQVQNTPRMQPNVYQITARNQTGCSTTSPILVRVTEGPVPFFVDPPIVYNGITLQATAYLGNLFGGSVTRVEIATNQGNPINLDFSFDASKPSQVKLIIPAGLAPGDYGITLYDDVNCPGSTAGLLKVTNRLGLTISSLTPPFAWTQSSTAINIFADSRTPFQPTPRSYLTPSIGNQCTLDQQCGINQLCRQGRCTNPCQNTLACGVGLACSGGACVPQAAELKASSLRSVTELQGIIAAGFAPGEYDFVTVNPNGDVGLLSKAIKININPPPQIEGVSPGSWKINEPALPVQISGMGFNQVSVKATCIANGQSSEYAVAVVSQTAQLIDTRINTGLLSANTVCSIRVTNADASYDDFSPLTTVNPSGNFVSFAPENDLPLSAARRLPAIVSAQIPNAGLSLFMIGGDLGSDNTALNDIYASQIDGFGRLGAWQKLPSQLPEALTHTQALNVGRFIYVLGGMKANGQASRQVLRAEILDPLYVPQITGVDFEFTDAIAGLNTGVYYYRITAIYDANDPNNPGGESLPSEPQPVFVPNIPIGVRLILSWTGQTDAVGYRIYRSPTPNLLLGQEQLIAEVPADILDFNDDGFVPISQQKPLNQGTLGHWKEVALLNTTRAQHASVVAPDPSNAKRFHLYSFAGLSNGVVSKSYDHFSVDTSNVRGHVLSTVSSFNTLSLSRTKLNALVATPQEASLLSTGASPKKAVIYVLGGDNTRTVEVAEVLNDGLLSPWLATADMSRSRIGYAAGIANNTLLTVCGQNGSASTTAEKGEICGAGCSPTVENLSRWSALGNTGALRACVNSGFASARGFFYLIGGGDNNNAISTKIDVSLLGGTP